MARIQTHSNVVLELSPASFAEIKHKLSRADYYHCFVKSGGRVMIDMKGIAVTELQGNRNLAGEIITAVCGEYNVTQAELMSKKRPDRITYPRHVAMTLCRQFCRLSFVEIGDMFNRDHGTVMHALATVDDRCKTDIRQAKKFAELQERFKTNGDQNE